MNPMKDQSLGISLISSLLLHNLAFVIAAAFVHYGSLGKQDFFNVKLVDIQSLSETAESPTENESLAFAKAKMAKETKPALKSESSRLEPPATPSAKDDSAKSVEAKPTLPAKTETPAIASTARIEGGGSEAGAGNLFGRGDIGVLPGAGTAGGGTAASGLGRGSGAPGLPAQPVLRTNREAKPIQTARATYPPMALRMGMEADVTLRIEVDAQGNVTKAEIIKSGGTGFDDEALKAVKQSRFEPAQKDGQNIPAEFTYIYRFRLQR
jgi:TonB family protein